MITTSRGLAVVRALLRLALGAATASSALVAQQVRGTVADSTSGLPLPGAVVTTLDSIGRIGPRSLTDERGSFVVTAPPETRRLRIVRLGFRPVEIDLPAARDSALRIGVVMTRIPYELQPVRVTAAATCPRRPDRTRALSLLEQARAGLLATVVARSARPARMKRLLIERRMVGASDAVARHRVRIESVPSTVASFAAARSATDFVRQGFAADSADGATFFAPDADVLLDDGFAAGYCFHIMGRDADRPNQIGLGFKAADRRRGRIDVDGALWIDTVARAIVDIEFRYIGLDRDLEFFGPGGRVQFREMTNGVVLIDRWLLRLVGVDPDTGMGRRPLDPVGRSRAMATGVRPRLAIAEAGGELARVSWEDGSTWVASLGTLSLTVTGQDGAPAAGRTVRLDDTDYQAATDSAGRLEIVDLAPGPYAAVVADARLEPLGITLRTPLAFTASRGVVVSRTLQAQTAEDFVRARCQQDRLSSGGSALLVGRVTTPDGKPIKGALWTLRLLPRGASEEKVAVESGVTGSDGIFEYCGAEPGTSARLSFRGPAETLTVSRELEGALTVVPVRLSPR